MKDYTARCIQVRCLHLTYNSVQNMKMARINKNTIQGSMLMRCWLIKRLSRLVQSFASTITSSLLSVEILILVQAFITYLGWKFVQVRRLPSLKIIASLTEDIMLSESSSIASPLIRTVILVKFSLNISEKQRFDQFKFKSSDSDVVNGKS